MSIDNTNQKDIDDLQAREIANLLDEHAKRLSMRTLKQLENSRIRAVKLHEAQTAGGSLNIDGSISQFTSWIDHHRIVATGLLLATIVSSFVVLQSLGSSESSDAFLLGSELPPEAFVDKGFEPSLNVPDEHVQEKT